MCILVKVVWHDLSPWFGYARDNVDQRMLAMSCKDRDHCCGGRTRRKEFEFEWNGACRQCLKVCVKPRCGFTDLGWSIINSLEQGPATKAGNAGRPCTMSSRIGYG